MNDFLKTYWFFIFLAVLAGLVVGLKIILWYF